MAVGGDKSCPVQKKKKNGEVIVSGDLVGAAA
jgi:hypothetical protein